MVHRGMAWVFLLFNVLWIGWMARLALKAIMDMVARSILLYRI